MGRRHRITTAKMRRTWVLAGVFLAVALAMGLWALYLATPDPDDILDAPVLRNEQGEARSLRRGIQKLFGD